MILYFSGTGNSQYVAQSIAKKTSDLAIDLFEKIKENDYSEMYSERPWVIVCPTYAWRIPRILNQWIKNTPLKGNRSIYFVMTCGGSIGNAGQYLKALCTSKKMNNMGCFPVIMPENYIALFNVPDSLEALNIIDKAEIRLTQAAQLINQAQPFFEPEIMLKDKISSGIINQLFYPVFVHSKKFYAKDSCVSCGKCVTVCPMKNIELVNGKPSWKNHCTHCMACICRCPVEAIEYGIKSAGKPRYVCPRKI